jgi:hypothetical protein
MGRHPEHHTSRTTLLETTPQGVPLYDTTPLRGGGGTKRALQRTRAVAPHPRGLSATVSTCRLLDLDLVLDLATV